MTMFGKKKDEEKLGEDLKEEAPVDKRGEDEVKPEVVPEVTGEN